MKSILEPSVDEKYIISEKHTNAMIQSRNCKKLNIADLETKSSCITASYFKIPNDAPYISIGNDRVRKLTPTECERLQTIPDGYASCVSNSQRYKVIGNGWTVDVIAHIFSHIK